MVSLRMKNYVLLSHTDILAYLRGKMCMMMYVEIIIHDVVANILSLSLVPNAFKKNLKN